jgi:type I restriction enzyme, S subunit
MKEGWQTRPLRDYAVTVSTGPFGSILHKSDYTDQGVPLVNPINIVGEQIVADTSKLIGEATKRRLNSYILEVGDIVVARRGEIGRCAVVSPNEKGWVCGTGSFFIRPASSIEPRFLAHLIRSDLYREKLIQASTGTTMANLSNTALGDLPISVPPRHEQQRIIKILDKAFESLAITKANVEKNLQNVQILFETHLRSVFGQSGKGWKQKTLQEVATTFGRGKSKHRPRNAPHLYGGKYPFVQTGDIRNADHIITEYSQTYSEAGLAQSKLWPKGTICITIAANIAETAILGFDACFPDSVIGVVVNPKDADIGFIEYLLQSFKVRIQAMGKGSAQANINMGTFENERFPFPPVAEQKKIVANLDALRTETQRLSSLYARKIKALEMVKNSLLHQAFSEHL